jgi:hypothetical protein
MPSRNADERDTAVGDGFGLRDQAFAGCFVHPEEMDRLSSARGQMPGTSGAPRTAWPGVLVDRVLSLVVAGCRWHGLRVAGPLILAAAAAVSSYANHPTLDFRLAVPLAVRDDLDAGSAFRVRCGTGQQFETVSTVA